jgi:hypothetical protein
VWPTHIDRLSNPNTRSIRMQCISQENPNWKRITPLDYEVKQCSSENWPVKWKYNSVGVLRIVGKFETVEISVTFQNYYEIETTA